MTLDFEFTPQQIQTIAEIIGKDTNSAKKYLEDLYKDLEDDEITFAELTEIAKEEAKSKKDKVKNYVRSAETAEKKPRKPKTVKISDEKSSFFAEIVAFLQNSNKNYEIVKENKLIYVNIGDKSFKLDLIESRKKK